MTPVFFFFCLICAPLSESLYFAILYLFQMITKKGLSNGNMTSRDSTGKILSFV